MKIIENILQKSGDTTLMGVVSQMKKGYSLAIKRHSTSKYEIVIQKIQEGQQRAYEDSYYIAKIYAFDSSNLESLAITKDEAKEIARKYFHPFSESYGWEPFLEEMYPISLGWYIKICSLYTD